MGNQLDRITHLNYSELPTGDPSGIEKDELRVGVAYFFSDEEEDLDDRSQPENYKDQSPSKDGHLVLNEIEYSAFCCQECIFSKLRENEDLNIYSIKTLLTMCKPGDLLELVHVANDQPPHWTIYQGDDQVIHLHKGEIRKDSLFEISNGRLGRIVNNRFGKREFKAGGEVHTAEQQYFLKIHLSKNNVHTLMFHSLEDLIRERRKVDATGKLRLLKELSIVSGKE
ncbi:FA84A protein, partial [Atractosteus spatula]|nr:FA84A protein [Atractosteus spatula]